MENTQRALSLRATCGLHLLASSDSVDGGPGFISGDERAEMSKQKNLVNFWEPLRNLEDFVWRNSFALLPEAINKKENRFLQCVKPRMKKQVQNFTCLLNFTCLFFKCLWQLLGLEMDFPLLMTQAFHPYTWGYSVVLL